MSQFNSHIDDNQEKHERRFRTIFTETQGCALEEAFKQSHYPTLETKREIGQKLGIPEHRITVWFQNRRAKWRRKINRANNKLNENYLPNEQTNSEPICYVSLHYENFQNQTI